MHFTTFKYLQQFSEINKCAGTFYTLGQLDPRPLTRGARGHVGWPGSAGANGPARPAPRRRQRPAMGGARASSEAREGYQPDQGLTGDPPVVLAWPEDGRQRRIWPAKSSISGEESATVAVTPATMAQFVWRGGRGRRRGPSQHVGGAGGSTGQRRYASSLDYWEVSRERGRGSTGKKSRAARERKKEGEASWRAGGAPEGVASSLGQAGGGELRNVQGLHAAAHPAKEEDKSLLHLAP
jgi:hypothetical protein